MHQEQCELMAFQERVGTQKPELEDLYIPCSEHDDDDDDDDDESK
jgi:hypothetical protein